jgi:hypothetical protein
MRADGRSETYLIRRVLLKNIKLKVLGPSSSRKSFPVDVEMWNARAAEACAAEGKFGYIVASQVVLLRGWSFGRFGWS